MKHIFLRLRQNNWLVLDLNIAFILRNILVDSYIIDEFKKDKRSMYLRRYKYNRFKI